MGERGWLGGRSGLLCRPRSAAVLAMAGSPSGEDVGITGGGGWSDGCSLEAGSHSLGSGPGGKAAENAETAGNCMALRNGLSGAGAELGLSESGMRLVTAAVLQSCLSQ